MNIDILKEIQSEIILSRTNLSRTKRTHPRTPQDDLIDATLNALTLAMQTVIEKAALEAAREAWSKLHDSKLIVSDETKLTADYCAAMEKYAKVTQPLPPGYRDVPAIKVYGGGEPATQQMKLYLLSRLGPVVSNQYFSAVVAAPNIESEMHTHPNGGLIKDWNSVIDWARSPSEVIVRYLGETNEPQGVICARFVHA